MGKNTNKKILDKDGLLEYFNCELEYYNNKIKLSKKYMCNTRLPGLSEVVSENIIKFCLINNNIMCKNANTGDLITNNQEKIECKCFTSSGPISFGPTEKWDKIVFLNAKQWFNNKFTIILIDLKNTVDVWENIKMNKKETFKDQTSKGRRPRITWDALDKQIESKYKSIIFEGSLDDILKQPLV
jgi:hypothetical protein